MKYCVDFVIFGGLTFSRSAVRLRAKITRTLSIYKVFIRYLNVLIHHKNNTIDSQLHHLIENERKHLNRLINTFINDFN